MALYRTLVNLVKNLASLQHLLPGLRMQKLTPEEIGKLRISVRTPLCFSVPLSAQIGRDVFLKLENAQPVSSFKIRGIAQLAKNEILNGKSKLIGSSGGNAGLALSYAAKKLRVPCEVFVPEYSRNRMIEKLKLNGAKVHVCGDDWQEANDEALAKVESDRYAAFVHPFDHPDIWEGHSSMILEIHSDLKGIKPSLIICSVGGGGLLSGILLGLEKVGWHDVAILAMETEGTMCYNLSLSENRIVEIKPEGIAKSLGARSIIPDLLERSNEFKIYSKTLTDRDAAMGCFKLADDHGFLVEPACGVSIASVYCGTVQDVLKEAKATNGPVVAIVCGGADITTEDLDTWCVEYDL